MAVASDLPDLENRRSTRTPATRCSTTSTGGSSAILTNNQRRVLVPCDEISPSIRNAVIAIEDQRFYENAGVDLRGIGRAFVQDVIQGRAAQGGSTITQQFVKNALERPGRPHACSRSCARPRWPTT